MNTEIEYFQKIDKNIKSNIESTLAKVCRKDIVKPIAVSKTKPNETLMNAYLAGIKIFGENYVQELVEKCKYFQSNNINDIEWHFIGHLQTNKVKYIIPFVHYIHSVDSLKLAIEIDKKAKQFNKIQNILLQVNTSGENSKSGCSPSEVIPIVAELVQLPNIKLVGLMTIGTFTDYENQQRKEFLLLNNLMKSANQSLNLNLKELSMGMTHDYTIAISEGATMVRIGTAYFGERNYNK